MKYNQEDREFKVFHGGVETGLISFNETLEVVNYESLFDNDSLMANSNSRFLSNNNEKNSGIPFAIEGLLSETDITNEHDEVCKRLFESLIGERGVPREIYMSNVVIVSVKSFRDKWHGKARRYYSLDEIGVFKKTNPSVVSTYVVAMDANKSMRDLSGQISTINIMSRESELEINEAVRLNSPRYDPYEKYESQRIDRYGAVTSGLQKKHTIMDGSNSLALAKFDGSHNDHIGECGLPAIEWLMTTLATKCGIDVPFYWVAETSDSSKDGLDIAYVSMLFGRPEKDSETIPLVLDACAAIGRTASVKGDPGISEFVCLMLKEVFSGRMDKKYLDDLVRHIAFSWHGLNDDFHMKNLSIIFEIDKQGKKANGTRLSPAYDLYGQLGYKRLKSFENFETKLANNYNEHLEVMVIPCLSCDKIYDSAQLIHLVVESFSLGFDLFEKEVKLDKKYANIFSKDYVRKHVDEMGANFAIALGPFTRDNLPIPDILKNSEVSVKAIKRSVSWLRCGPEYVAEEILQQSEYLRIKEEHANKERDSFFSKPHKMR